MRLSPRRVNRMFVVAVVVEGRSAPTSDGLQDGLSNDILSRCPQGLARDTRIVLARAASNELRGLATPSGFEGVCFGKKSDVAFALLSDTTKHCHIEVHEVHAFCKVPQGTSCGSGALGVLARNHRCN